MSWKNLTEHEAEIWDEVLLSGKNFDAFHDLYFLLIMSRIKRTVAKYREDLLDSDIEDISNKVWMDLIKNDMKKIRKWKPDGGYSRSTWIGMIANHSTCDYLRGLKGYHNESTDDGRTEYPDDEGDIHPEDTLMYHEQLDMVNKAIRRLSEFDQQFISMAVTDGYSTTALSEYFNIGVSTVYSKRTKIIQKIKNRVRRY